MFDSSSNIILNPLQWHILDLIEQKPYLQKDLVKEIGKSGSTIQYNLNQLEKYRFIEKSTVQTIGSASIKEIKVKNSAIQKIRYLLGRNISEFTLITGFGKDSDLFQSYMLPITSLNLLKKENYQIENIILCITPESNLDEFTKLIQPTETITFPYTDYRSEHSKLFDEIIRIIEMYTPKTNIILDLTPLTKLYTLFLLQQSINYQFPSFYLGYKSSNEYELIWTYRPENNQKIFSSSNRKERTS